MKKILIIIISNLLLFELLSATLIYAIGIVRPNWRLDLRMEKHFADISQDYLNQALQRKRDKLLGWNTRSGDFKENSNIAGKSWQALVGPDGSRNDGVEHEQVLIATYGDSFTFGEEVDDTETWQYFLEKKIGKDVKNYGVSAYGVGQIWLKIQRHLQQDRVEKITIFTIFEGDLDRAVTGFRPFLQQNTSVILGFKPSFRYLNSQVTFIPNPWINSAQTLVQLKALAIDAAKTDYWVSHNSLITLKFPYSLQSIKVVPFLFNRLLMKLSDKKYNNSLWLVDEGKIIMRYILEKYVEEVREKGSIPVVLFIPQVRNKMSKSWRQPDYTNFKNTILEDSIENLVVLDVYDAEFKTELFNILPFKGHPSVYGNNVIANYVANNLKKLSLIN